MNTDLDPKKYREVVVVCGTRKFENKALFSSAIRLIRSMVDEKVLFVSGAASSGADRLIINYCHAYRLPCLEIPAQWEQYKRAAGMIRNKEMLKIATRVVAFWDGESSGTTNMVENSRKMGLPLHIIDTNTRKVTHEGKRLTAAQLKEGFDRLGQPARHETGEDTVQQPGHSLSRVEQSGILPPGDGRLSGGEQRSDWPGDVIESTERAFRFTSL
jgi:hypothetical protein